VIGAGLLTVTAWAVVAVSLHRLMLFGDRQCGSWLILRFGKVEAMFAALPVLYIVTVAVLSALGVPLERSWKGGPALIAMCVFAVAIFFIARFVLVHPVMVVDRRADVRQAWDLSRGNVWRMIGLLIVVTTPPVVVAGVLQSLLIAVLNLTPAAMTAEQFDESLWQILAIYYPTSIVVWALCVGMLSLMYKALCGLPSDFVVKPKA
jgi:hypothetical protein